MTQKDAIKNHLEEHGSITSLEAINLFGITRLSDVIYRLKRQDDMVITTTNKTVKNRFGGNSTYCVYHYKKNESIA